MSESSLTVLPLVCGRTHVEDGAEAIVQRLRAQQGFRTDGGCNGKLVLLHAYRCLECGRWMHADCLRGHFAESGDDQKAAIARPDGGEG